MIIPVTILTGFLGSGKTNLLANILSLKNMSGTAVIINEFGEFSLDHLLVDHITEQTFELPGGCLCCNAGGQLVDKMLELDAQRKNSELHIDRLIIETSGMADAENLVAALWNNPQIGASYRLAKIITVVSATEWSVAYANNSEFSKQIALSDNIVVSKSDLLDEFSKQQQLGQLISGLKTINNHADIFMLPISEIHLKELIEPGSNHNEHAQLSPPGTHKTDKYQTFSLTHTNPISQLQLEQFVDILLRRHSRDLLRVKGLARTLENPNRPMVIQCVGSTMSPITWLEKWQEDPVTQLTVIHTGNICSQVLSLFNSMLNIPELDQPDNTALTENPLSVTGLGNFEPGKY